LRIGYDDLARVHPPELLDALVNRKHPVELNMCRAFWDRLANRKLHPGEAAALLACLSTGMPAAHTVEILVRSLDERRPLRHDGREYALILSGTLTANIGFESYDLEPGDSIAFDASTPHEYLNKTGEIVRAHGGTLAVEQSRLPPGRRGTAGAAVVISLPSTSSNDVVS